jgi:hypothetical protein
MSDGNHAVADLDLRRPPRALLLPLHLGRLWLDVLADVRHVSLLSGARDGAAPPRGRPLVVGYSALRWTLETLDLQVLDDEGAGGLRHAVLLVAAELEVALDPDAVARGDELREALPVVAADPARDGLAVFVLLGADGDREGPDLAVGDRDLARGRSSMMGS